MKRILWVIVCCFLVCWFADAAACGRINPWVGTFIAAVLYKEVIEVIWEYAYGKKREKYRRIEELRDVQVCDAEMQR